MKTILVATDFSPAAMNAANYATDMAMEIDAGILLFHVYQIPVVYLEVPMAMNEESLRLDVENEILLLKEKLTLRSGSKVTIETKVRMGTFFSELESISEQIKPYVVVMGSQGTTAAERFFFGGHTVYAMQHLKWPIITLPDKAVFSPLKKIGLACDFNKVASKVPVSQIKALINDFKSALYVINSGKQGAVDPEITFEAESLSERFTAIKPHFNFIVSKDPDQGIVDFAEKNHIDMLVVLPKNHDLLHKMVYGSHTKQLLLDSQIPVMAIHPS